MNLVNTRRAELEEVPYLNNALDGITASINAIWNVEHDEAGHHTAITADSITVEDATITGDLVVAGDQTIDGGVTIDGTLTVEGATVLNNGLGVDGNADVTGTLTAVTATADHFTGGDLGLIGDITTTGDVFATDIDATNGYTERARATKMGEWIAVAFNALNFFANGVQTWTVGSGDVVVNRYMLVGKTLMWKVGLTGTTVGGTPNTELRISIPGGFTAANYSIAPLAVVTDNGTQMVGFVEATNGQTLVSIKLNIGATNWTNATDNTAVFFTIAIEVA
jgi:cytoskeletal protein CcmA (bactofilin family)